MEDNRLNKNLSMAHEALEIAKEAGKEVRKQGPKDSAKRPLFPEKTIERYTAGDEER